METLFLLIPVVLILLAFAVWALIWAIKSGQFDDLEGPAYRILHDEDDPRIPFNQPDQDQPEEDTGSEDTGEDAGAKRDRY
ncbi:cbb3-type cytochrome oxidase assembly protein CcoS [Thiohalorhabdus sp.]|uniref:cbb3-type cytochrome oxidase assembly protein CcoS n=1 Tax=Thiohalorhabdus sp. TaxID=3094134 RepID=UPI002FC2F7CB